MVKLSDTQGADWQEMAKIYKQLTVGTSSRPIGVMLEKANALLPFSEATGVHDSGCGPGPVLGRIIKDYGNQIPETCSLTASDFSAGMIEQVENTKKAEINRDAKSPWSRVHASVLDCMDLKGVVSGSKSHITAASSVQEEANVLLGWVYFMVDRPRSCLDESLRVLKSGGVLTCSSWKDSQWMQLMGLVTKVRPDAPMPRIPEQWRTAEGVRDELSAAGFLDVESVEVEVEMNFESQDALLDLLTLQMPVMKKLLSTWTADEVVQLREVMATKSEEYCPDSPGKLSGVALVAVGRRPQ